jgi:NADH pyrophosphatase NudC (nudix superfamily)
MDSDSVEFDEFGRVYTRPIHYGPGVVLTPGATAPKVNLEVRFCVICGKKLSMYNTDKNKVCYSETCEKKFRNKS